MPTTSPHKQSIHTTRSWQWRLPAETETVIVDSPAALEGYELHDITYEANCIIVPIMPSAIDIRFAARFIADLLLLAQIERHDRTLAIVANRTRHNTRCLRQLMRFLNSLRIPVIAVLRDSQNFVVGADEGIGIHDMPASQVRHQLGQMNRIVRWIEHARLRPDAGDNMMTPQPDLTQSDRPVH